MRRTTTTHSLAILTQSSLATLSDRTRHAGCWLFVKQRLVAGPRSWVLRLDVGRRNGQSSYPSAERALGEATSNRLVTTVLSAAAVLRPFHGRAIRAVAGYPATPHELQLIQLHPSMGVPSGQQRLDIPLPPIGNLTNSMRTRDLQGRVGWPAAKPPRARASAGTPRPRTAVSILRVTPRTKEKTDQGHCEQRASKRNRPEPRQTESEREKTTWIRTKTNGERARDK